MRATGKQTLRLGGVDIPQMRVELNLPDGSRLALYNIHLLPPRRGRSSAATTTRRGRGDAEARCGDVAETPRAPPR